jgi:threonine synthase
MWRFWFAVGGFKMNYISTRGASPAIGFLDAVLAGLAPDGGLYVPEVWPSFTPQEIARFSGETEWDAPEAQALLRAVIAATAPDA